MMAGQTYFKKLYQKYPLEKREIDLLLCHFLKVNTAGLITFSDSISEPLQQDIENAIGKRLNGMPMAYIAGSKGFWALDLLVNQHTLIPRPETELMVELVLKLTDKHFSGNILDLGTGAGTIALSVAKERPLANITAIDYCVQSLKVARINQQRYKLNNVKIFRSNWFINIDKNNFDFILSNPPYVAENDPHLLDLKHEPITALTAKNNGLADLQHIIEQAISYLNPNAYVILEHGFNQAQALHNIFKLNRYKNVKTHKDLAKIPRITAAQY